MPAKIFRDPLYNYISIDRERDKWLLQLVDSPEVQRLRRIHQLGVSHVTYPGADHSRFSHSLGVLHLMQQALDHLDAIGTKDAQVHDARIPLLAAALLHDIGHGPFSHLFEPCLDIDHEYWSVQIIKSPDTQVNRILRDIDGQLPDRVAALIEEDNPNAIYWQKHLLSSQLDIDRLEYLRRDSLFTGAGYGHFDWYRLLHTFELHGETGKHRDLVWLEKAKYGIEEYIFARFYMYQNVYMHHTTRGFEKVVQAMWRHARKLWEDGTDVDLLGPIEAFWKADPPTVADFLALEESVVLYQIQKWTSHADKALSDLARRFMQRDRFATIEAPPSEKKLDDLSGWEDALRKLVASKGYEPPEMYALKDDMRTRIYDAYWPEKEPGEQEPGTAIRIRIEGETEPVEISRLLVRLQAVTNKPARQVRYYVPREIREDVKELASKWTG